MSGQDPLQVSSTLFQELWSLDHSPYALLLSALSARIPVQRLLPKRSVPSSLAAHQANREQRLEVVMQPALLCSNQHNPGRPFKEVLLPTSNPGTLPHLVPARIQLRSPFSPLYAPRIDGEVVSSSSGYLFHWLFLKSEVIEGLGSLNVYSLLMSSSSGCEESTLQYEQHHPAQDSQGEAVLTERFGACWLHHWMLSFITNLTQRFQHPTAFQKPIVLLSTHPRLCIL